MGLKRLRSVDPAAGMKSISFFPVATFIVIAEVSKNVNWNTFLLFSWNTAEKIESKQWCRKYATAKEYCGYA